MDIERQSISDVIVLKPRIFRDDRGFFSEAFNARSFAQACGTDVQFVQDNHSLSVSKGVVRGLHFQTGSDAQGKLIRVSHGAIFDVAVDLRRGSPTFGRHVCAVLSAENWAQMWIPVGFAHGFCTLESNTEVLYKATSFYAPHADRALKWNDPALGIAWPVAAADAILSAKDSAAPNLSDLEPCFDYAA